MGEVALRRRAADEVWEEAGLRVRPEAIELLGGSFPSAGMTAERFWLTAVEVAPEAALAEPEGDGSPMEEGASVRWVALDEALASEPDPNATVAIGLSFRSTDGRICRTFLLRSPPARAGLACRSDAGWALPVLSAVATPEGGGELRQAASALPPAVQAAVDARLRGNVFDARQERAARDAGWR